MLLHFLRCLVVLGVLAGPAFFALAPAAWAQASSAQSVVVVLVDGSEVTGTIEEESDAIVVLRTALGVRMEIPRDQIERITATDARSQLRADPHATRLLFTSTARPIGKGNGYLAVYELLFPFAAAGVGERVSLAGGFSLIPGVSSQLVYIAPKVTVYNRPQSAVALGAYVGRVGFLEGESPVLGLLYGLGTWGSTERAVTVGAGYAFAGEERADRPVLMVGGEYQLSNRLKLLSENYIVPGIGEATLGSLGLRFIGDTISADFGFFIVLEAIGETDGLPALPWLSFSYHFGR